MTTYKKKKVLQKPNLESEDLYDLNIIESE